MCTGPKFFLTHVKGFCELGVTVNSVGEKTKKQKKKTENQKHLLAVDTEIRCWRCDSILYI